MEELEHVHSVQSRVPENRHLNQDINIYLAILR